MTFKLIYFMMDPNPNYIPSCDFQWCHQLFLQLNREKHVDVTVWSTHTCSWGIKGLQVPDVLLNTFCLFFLIGPKSAAPPPICSAGGQSHWLLPTPWATRGSCLQVWAWTSPGAAGEAGGTGVDPALWSDAGTVIGGRWKVEADLRSAGAEWNRSQNHKTRGGRQRHLEEWERSGGAKSATVQRQTTEKRSLFFAADVLKIISKEVETQHPFLKCCAVQEVHPDNQPEAFKQDR